MILAVAMMVCLGGIEAIEVESTLGDGTQPCSLLNPGGEAPRPLLVFLHTWSTGYDNFDWTPWREEAEKRGWLVLVPHYQGPNCRPEACASARARQDILDAVDYVCAHYPVDKARIYLAGVSGGGHMSMVMAAHAPERWTAVSAWAGISDLAAWHKECVEKGRKYAGDIEAVAGGAPGSSDAVDRELYFRSPVHHLAAAKDLPLDLNTGIHDGHTGSVPIHHTLDAFNAVARCQGAKVVTDQEIACLSREEPLASEETQDETYGRRIHLRREAGLCRVTIFEGGHEGIPAAACAWLAAHAKE